MRIGLADISDPNCSNSCLALMAAASAVPGATGYGAIAVNPDCAACFCPGGQLWNTQTKSCAPTLPTPIAPSVTISSAGTYAGTDSNGNPVYFQQSTPQQDQAATIAAIAGNAQGQGVDCSGWVNSIFDSSCNGGGMSWTAIIGGTIALLAAGYVAAKVLMP